LTRLVAFSGPPRAGKDTIAHELHAILVARHPRLDVRSIALSMPLRLAIYNLAGIPYSREHYETHKDQPQEVFGNETIREAMIGLAEEHIRPRYGRDFYARSLLNRELPGEPDVILVTDVGFDEENSYFQQELGFDQVVAAHLYREGRTFAGDSRGYAAAHNITQLANSEDPVTVAGRLYGRLVNQFSWNLG